MKVDLDNASVDLESRELFLPELEMILSVLRLKGRVHVENCAGVFSLVQFVKAK